MDVIQRKRRWRWGLTTPCDLVFLVSERISLWEYQEWPTFTIKNILMCQHSWLDGVSVIFPPLFFLLIKELLESSRAEFQTMSWCVSAWLHAAAGHSSVCVFDHCHYQLLSSGWETPTPRPPFLSFHISISFFVLLSPQVTYVRVGGVSADISRRKKGHALVPSISPHLYLSLLQDFRMFGQSDPLIYPLPDIKSVGKIIS